MNYYNRCKLEKRLGSIYRCVGSLSSELADCIASVERLSEDNDRSYEGIKTCLKILKDIKKFYPSNKCSGGVEEFNEETVNDNSEVMQSMDDEFTDNAVDEEHFGINYESDNELTWDYDYTMTFSSGKDDTAVTNPLVIKSTEQDFQTKQSTMLDENSTITDDKNVCTVIWNENYENNKESLEEKRKEERRQKGEEKKKNVEENDTMKEKEKKAEERGNCEKKKSEMDDSGSGKLKSEEITSKTVNSAYSNAMKSVFFFGICMIVTLVAIKTLV
ncbi:hypothetical protein THOM_2913 [Trachipleistophora hominis]|uniref:Uncharacterized protein n=1 Tax=Trachipleistophora hominis TaxID=72359 RepID=L7JSC2_TRAHO|nr:hypothetical protein THOM_2913 [Trachipleistophora hominis]